IDKIHDVRVGRRSRQGRPSTRVVNPEVVYRSDGSLLADADGCAAVVATGTGVAENVQVDFCILAGRVVASIDPDAVFGGAARPGERDGRHIVIADLEERLAVR